MVNRESAATALAHLEMICQAVGGDYSLKQGELEKRRAAIVAFILTGQCVADVVERKLIESVERAVTIHFDSQRIAGERSETPSAQPDAA